jgi:oligoendopeptidase F
MKTKSDPVPIPSRAEVPEKDRWNLSSLYPDDASWEAELVRYRELIPRIESFQGRLGESSRSQRLPRF